MLSGGRSSHKKLVLIGGWNVQVYRRADLGRRQEEYQLIGTFDEEPGSSEITKLFNDNQHQREAEARQGKAWWQA